MCYTFCPKCGGKLKQQNINLLICQECGFYFHQNPKPCTAAILENEKGEILIVKRKFKPHKGMWDLPGGFVDLNENLEKSLCREIKEETGIQIKANQLQYLASYLDRYLYQGINNYCVSITFVGKTKNQPIKIADDVSDYKFIKPDKINPSKLAFNGMKLALKDYLTIKGKRGKVRGK